VWLFVQLKLPYDGLATVPAVWQDEVLVPGEE
jgi:hypothetical protein